MNRDVLVKRISEIKPGTFFRLKYKTELPVNARSRDLGIQVEKRSEVTVRTGVEYKNIAGVEVKGTTRENNYEWVIPRKISHNTKTGLDYLNVATCKWNAYPHNTYTVNGKEVTKEQIKEAGYLIDSYWNRKDGEVRVIKCDNILQIGKAMECE